MSSSEMSECSPPKKTCFWDIVTHGDGVTDIKSLSEGMYPERDIKLRVTRAGTLAQSQRGTNWIRITGADNSGSVQIVAFGAKARSLANDISVGRVLKLKGYKVTLSQVTKELEIILLESSSWVFEEGDTVFHPLEYKFVAFDKVDPAVEVVDVIGVIINLGNVDTWESNGRQWKRRFVNLLNEQNDEIGVTVWGQDAEQPFVLYEPLAVLKAHTQVYQGIVGVQTKWSSVVWRSPDIKEATELKAWFQKECEAKGVKLP